MRWRSSRSNLGSDYVHRPRRGATRMAAPTASGTGTDAEDAAALAPLSVTLIRTQTDPGSFDRGSDYFRKGMIRDPLRRGAVLQAESRGSSGGPYRVEATLAAAGAA